MDYNNTHYPHRQPSMRGPPQGPPGHNHNGTQEDDPWAVVHHQRQPPPFSHHQSTPMTMTLQHGRGVDHERQPQFPDHRRPISHGSSSSSIGGNDNSMSMRRRSNNGNTNNTPTPTNTNPFRKRAAKRRAKHELPGPAGVWFRQQKQKSSTTANTVVVAAKKKKKKSNKKKKKVIKKEIAASSATITIKDDTAGLKQRQQQHGNNAQQQHQGDNPAMTQEDDDDEEGNTNTTKSSQSQQSQQSENNISTPPPDDNDYNNNNAKSNDDSDDDDDDDDESPLSSSNTTTTTKQLKLLFHDHSAHLHECNAWNLMCTMLNRVVPPPNVTTTTTMLLHHHQNNHHQNNNATTSSSFTTNYKQLLRSSIPKNYALLHEIHDGKYDTNHIEKSPTLYTNDLSLPLIVVYVASVQCHAHSDWTAILVDEMHGSSGKVVGGSSNTTNANNTNNNNNNNANKGIPCWIEERLVKQHPSWIRPGAVWLLEGAKLALFSVVGDDDDDGGGGGDNGYTNNTTTANTPTARMDTSSPLSSTGGGGGGNNNNNNNNNIDRMILVGESSMVYAWTPEESCNSNIFTHEEFVDLTERRLNLGMPEEEGKKKEMGGDNDSVIEIDDDGDGDGGGSDEEEKEKDGTVVGTAVVVGQPIMEVVGGDDDDGVNPSSNDFANLDGTGDSINAKKSPVPDSSSGEQQQPRLTDSRNLGSVTANTTSGSDDDIIDIMLSANNDNAIDVQRNQTNDKKQAHEPSMQQNKATRNRLPPPVEEESALEKEEEVVVVVGCTQNNNKRSSCEPKSRMVTPNEGGLLGSRIDKNAQVTAPRPNPYDANQTNVKYASHPLEDSQSTVLQQPTSLNSNQGDDDLSSSMANMQKSSSGGSKLSLPGGTLTNKVPSQCQDQVNSARGSEATITDHHDLLGLLQTAETSPPPSRKPTPLDRHNPCYAKESSAQHVPISKPNPCAAKEMNTKINNASSTSSSNEWQSGEDAAVPMTSSKKQRNHRENSTRDSLGLLQFAATKASSSSVRKSTAKQPTAHVNENTMQQYVSTGSRSNPYAKQKKKSSHEGAVSNPNDQKSEGADWATGTSNKTILSPPHPDTEKRNSNGGTDNELLGLLLSAKKKSSPAARETASAELTGHAGNKNSTSLTSEVATAAPPTCNIETTNPTTLPPKTLGRVVVTASGGFNVQSNNSFDDMLDENEDISDKPPAAGGNIACLTPKDIDRPNDQAQMKIDTGDSFDDSMLDEDEEDMLGAGSGIGTTNNKESNSCDYLGDRNAVVSSSIAKLTSMPPGGGGSKMNTSSNVIAPTKTQGMSLFDSLDGDDMDFLSEED